MKWNWGTKIVLFFMAFAAFIIYLVVMSFQENIDLVTEDYYGEELLYEERIQQTNNANSLENKVKVLKESEGYKVIFPQEKIEEGTLHFYRPDNKAFDKEYDLKGLSEDFHVPSADLIPGRYRVKIKWVAQAEKYYQEELLFVK